MGAERSIQDFKMSFFQTLFGWTTALGDFLVFFSLSDLLDRCSLYNSYFFCSYAPSVHFLCALAFCVYLLSMKFITYQKKMFLSLGGGLNVLIKVCGNCP